VWATPRSEPSNKNIAGADNLGTGIDITKDNHDYRRNAGC